MRIVLDLHVNQKDYIQILVYIVILLTYKW